jgi:precorrin-6Y C5,15-methyltransferase (decarboxylating)
VGLEHVLARRAMPTCILASGDPFFFGIGATIARHLEPREFRGYPAPSSMSLAAARLGWALQDVDVVSLHGRDQHGIIRYLQPGRRVLALSWDRETPPALADLLGRRGFGSSRLHVLEALGAADERHRSCRADVFDCDGVVDLNIVAIEVEAEAEALVVPARGSLPDAAFENDGQLTKQDVRAVTLSALAPLAGARLWDVGAGAGSVAIEWMLGHPSCEAVAVERDPERCARIRRNARHLGVPTLDVVEGWAPQALAGLAPPDAIFIGGGGGDVAVFERCWEALRPRGRLVVNAVSLETEAIVLRLHSEHGGELRRISMETAVPLGSMTGWRPAMPVVQWRITKA